MRRCLLKGCEQRYHPRQARQRYCSESCREAARKWSRWKAQQRYRCPAYLRGEAYLTLHDGARAWKGFDWGVLGRLHDKGMIHDPVGKVKSVVFTQEGLERAKALFEEMFKN